MTACTDAGKRGRVEGRTASFLEQLAIARADGSLTAEQVRPQVPPEMAAAVEALAAEIRNGVSLKDAERIYEIPLLALGPDWDFSDESKAANRKKTKTKNDRPRL